MTLKNYLIRYLAQSWVIKTGTDVLTWRIGENHLALNGMVGYENCTPPGEYGHDEIFPCFDTQRWKIQHRVNGNVCKLNCLF